MQSLLDLLTALLRKAHAVLQELLRTIGGRLAPERWALHVVCVSPVASVRAALTHAKGDVQAAVHRMCAAT